MLRDALEMLLALGRSALCHVARHRRCSGWDDHASIRMVLGDGAVDVDLIIGSVADGGERSCDLVEQELDL
jgi:hypothetical protein